MSYDGPIGALDRLRNRNTVAGEHVIVLDGVWAADRNTAKRRVDLARDAGDDASLERAEKDLAELDARRDDATLAFRFRRLSMRQYRALVEACPPTAEQMTAAEALPAYMRPQFDADRFPRALLEETLVDPALSAEEIGVLLGEGDGDALLSPAETVMLLEACAQVQNNAPRLD